MAKILEMPKLSPTMEEGVISAWHKREGDAIEVDDLLAEVETDKATMEFRAFDKGTLLKILAPAGEQVKLGQAVAVVGSPGEDVSVLVAGAQRAPSGVALQAAAPPPPPAAPAEKPPLTSPSGTQPLPVAAYAPPTDTAPPPAQRKPLVGHALDRTSFAGEPPPSSALGAQAAPAGQGPAGARVLASPYVRQVARDLGVDLKDARGTGPGGRVLPGDVDAMRSAATASLSIVKTSPQGDGRAPSAITVHTGAQVPGALAEPEVRPLSQMRKAIARRLTESKTTVPHFYLRIDVDAGELVALREKINQEISASDGAGPPFKVSINDLLVKACAVALRRVPECNASFTPDAILVHRRVDISVAVAISEGLVTPVVRSADQKSVVAIARESKDLAARARAKKLKPEEMANGTFSISNLGMFGIDEFAAVINPPEGAILAVGQVREVPAIASGALVTSKRMALTLSCDHRVVDGAIGASFLAELRGLIEHPLRVLAG
jgi:pyruvate dehydrogenase E2 component (dihydrolipoamide acetyltransferase)